MRDLGLGWGSTPCQPAQDPIGEAAGEWLVLHGAHGVQALCCALFGWAALSGGLAELCLVTQLVNGCVQL